MYHCLGDLRADAADDAVGAHEPSGGDSFEEVLGDECVDGWNAGNVDYGDVSFVPDDTVQQVFHHDLGASGIQRADQRQRQDPLPQFDHRCRKLRDLGLLPYDHFLPRALERFYHEQTKGID
jgi:hypothetical protein